MRNRNLITLILFSLLTIVFYSCKFTDKLNDSVTKEDKKITKIKKVIFITINDNEYDSLLLGDNDGGLVEVMSDFKYYSDEIQSKWGKEIEFESATRCNNVKVNDSLICDNNELISTVFIDTSNSFFVVKGVMSTIDFETYATEGM